METVEIVEGVEITLAYRRDGAPVTAEATARVALADATRTTGLGIERSADGAAWVADLPIGLFEALTSAGHLAIDGQAFSLDAEWPV
ncbi:hypothetical protein [Parafrankia sp. EUN1f]|uniref:hypothetical protein n=1 Tax=Parafrankia sp. EUN1f TaxID=102897 RepID=UPI0001C44A7D|nr:hypothetical protein [Parafrankia sp. EUN1f]EFC84500.1 hypothetical protein FrEUN1fDRAFT_2430 [Parafrankia sp. EUN1f]